MTPHARLSPISLLACTLLFAAAALPALGAQIMRGPFLQQQNPDSMNVVWFTDSTSTGQVEWGLTTGYGNLTQSTPSGTRHEVAATGLSADTLYHYRVRCDGVPLTDDATFRTAPPGSATAVSFTFVGDSCSAPSNCTATFNAMLPEVANGFCITLGDLAGRGEDNITDYWQSHFFTPAASFIKHVCMYTTIGNHELYDETATYVYPTRYLYNWSQPTASSGSEFYYSFDKAHVHFVSIDTFWSSYAAGSAQRNWLANDLAVTTRPWKIVFGHDGPYISEDGSSHGSSTMRTHLVPLFAQYDVDLYLHGHYHNYERNMIGGVNYIDQGTGGQPWSSKHADDSQSYVQAYADQNYCFSRFDIQGNRLIGRCIKTSDGTILDGFQIDKPPIGMPWQDAFPAGGPQLNWMAPWNFQSQCGLVTRAGNPSGDGQVFEVADTSGHQYLYPMLAGESLTGCSIEAQVYYDGGSPVKNRFGIGLRGRLLFSTAEHSCYALVFVRNDPVAPDGHCLLVRQQGATETVLADWAYPNESRWYKMRLSMAGYELSAWIDDQLMTATPIQDSALPKGRPFIYNYRADGSGAKTLVDDVFIGPATGPPPSDTITDFEGYTDGTQVMFCQPSFSGSTNPHLLVSPNISQVVTAPAFGGTKVCQVEWAWVDATPQRWLRLTTHDLARVGNPTLDLRRPLRFRCRLATPGSLRLCLGIRETGVDVPIGADGGTTGTLEWVGATTVVDGAPQGRLISDQAGQWQTIAFDLPNESVQPFTGDGVLGAACDKGVLEHIALAVVDGAGPFTVQFDVFEQPPIEPPTITQHPVSQSINLGETAVFSVTAGGSEPMSYQWQKDSADLNDGDHYAGAATPVLTVSNADETHAGEYRCVVGNLGGSATSNEATLTVIGPPPIPGDYDGDRDVDQADFGHFQACMSGSGTSQDDPDCHDARLDGDSDVDGGDFALFHQCMSGEGVPANPDCLSG